MSYAFYIYIAVGLAWSAFILTYAIKKWHLLEVYTKRQKLVRIPFAILFNTVLWPISAPLISYKAFIKKKIVSLTYFTLE